jgi:hypothetical protein
MGIFLTVKATKFMGATLHFGSMTNVQLQKHIRALAKNSDSVFLSQHAQDRMASRGVSDVQVFECLRYGFIERPAVRDRKTGDLKCRMEHFGTHRNLSVVVALDDNDPDVIVVTVMTRAR